MNQAQIGNRIKLCRKKKALTQEALAETVGVSPHYIYEIERGTKKMSINILEELALSLDVSIDYLVWGSQISSSGPYDELDLLINNLTPKDRIIVADILSSIIPYIK